VRGASRRKGQARTWLVVGLALLVEVGCAGIRREAGAPDGGGPAGSDAPTATDARPTSDVPAPMTDAPPPPPAEHPPPMPGKVYAHSADTLYLLEPLSKQVTRVGAFDCVGTTLAPGSMVDVAVDRTGNMIGSAGVPVASGLGGALVTIDPMTAHCRILNTSDSLPTSLTYVPVGTLHADREALVGYADDRYVEIDPSTGAQTLIGMLNDAASGGTRWVSSGDIVSIMGAATYLTVVADSGPMPGGDRIVEVDPKTGALVRVIGATGSDGVLGLGYWGGVAYGFTIDGHLIQINLTTGAGSDIPIPNPDPDLSFLGAGTTTVAPIFID
jgi:hypothetical protein